ncbi:MAG: ABC transporter permease [Lachnospiraceae bacterium]|nr:ABC transporter permease [Lachnospiraceae bacterium]
MLWYIIKNNLKLMLRHKWIVVMLIIGPVITTAVLSSAFESMLSAYEGTGEFLSGYQISKASPLSTYAEEMQKNAKAAGFSLAEFDTGEPKELMEKHNLSSFTKIEKDSYTVYTMHGKENEGMVTEYFYNSLFEELELAAIQGNYPRFSLPVTKLETMPEVSSTDYYGIIYHVYYLWLCFISISVVFSSEKKNQIAKKYQVSGVKSLTLVLGKAIPCILSTLITLGISMIISYFLFGISWGGSLMTPCILFLTVVAATMFGLFVVKLTNNLAISVVIIFMMVWLSGFIGGSFETYMFSAWSEDIKVLSPIYHVNRALVECSQMGHSKYCQSAILYLTGISVVCLLGTIFLQRRRREETIKTTWINKIWKKGGTEK